MDIKTICDIFYQKARQYPNKEMFLYKEGGRYRGISASEMKSRVTAIANGLISLGLSANGKVGILSSNCWQWAAVDLGIISTGAADVTLYPTLLPDQIAFILNDSDTEMLFVENRLQYEKVAEIRDQCFKLNHVFIMDNSQVSAQNVLTLDELMATGRQYAANHGEALSNRLNLISPDDLMTVVYTSGTTGVPKGVMLSHRNLLSNIRQIEKLYRFGEGSISLSFLPLSHVTERQLGYYAMMYFDVTIAYAERIETVAENMLEVRPTHMVSVPRLYEKIYAKIIDAAMTANPLKRKIFFWAVGVGKAVAARKMANRKVSGLLAFRYSIAKILVFNKLKEKTGGRIEFFVSGGAPLSREIAEFFLAADLLIFEGYGLTETAPVIAANFFGMVRPGTVGKVMPDYTVRIAEDGEILFRGENLMLGYYKNKKATDEAIVDGWFHTGDIGFLDEDGFLTITDRKKELLITSGGKNIAPQPIEGKLKNASCISQAVLVGDSRKFISALIVPDFETIAKWLEKNGKSFTTPEAAIQLPEVIGKIQNAVDEVNDKLARYEQVKKFTLLPRELSQEEGELTPTLKLKRRVINDRYHAEIEQMYLEP